VTASKANLWGGAIGVVVGLLHLATDSPWLGLALVFVGSILIVQYLYLNVWGDDA